MTYIYFTSLSKTFLSERRYFTADFTNIYPILSDKKFNEEQLLLETFFLKMHIERDIRKKLIFKFIQSVRIPIKKLQVGGAGLYFLHSNFCRLIFVIFFPL